MRLAAWITRYWVRHVERADRIFEGGLTLLNLPERLYWAMMYQALWITARLKGYSSLNERAFILRCMNH